jgi:hypothetical protein
MIDIKHLEVAGERGMTAAAARELGESFARELAAALGPRAHEPLGIDRLRLDAPPEVLSRPGALREMARRTARELRLRIWRE